MPTDLTLVDLETTGLDPFAHRIWELAAIRRRPDGSQEALAVQVALTEAEISLADPGALSVGGFRKRYRPDKAVSPAAAAQRLERFASGSVLMAVNVSFDVAFLRVLLHRSGVQPSWHYSPADVKSFAAGALGLEPPWSSQGLADALGISQEDYARHDALEDCRYGLDLYDRALGRGRAAALPADANAAGEYLRGLTFTGEGYGCYETFDVREDGTHVNWAERRRIATLLCPDAEDDDLDDEAQRSFSVRFQLAEGTSVTAWWLWDGDGHLAFVIGPADSPDRVLSNTDCKKPYMWEDIQLDGGPAVRSSHERVPPPASPAL